MYMKYCLTDVSKLRAVRMKEGTTYRLIIKFRVSMHLFSLTGLVS